MTLLDPLTLIVEETNRAVGAEVISCILTGEVARGRSEGDTYWENTYIIAWRIEDKKFGTHQANVNSEGRCAIFSGHYGIGTIDDAFGDMLERANLTVKEI